MQDELVPEMSFKPHWDQASRRVRAVADHLQLFQLGRGLPDAPLLQRVLELFISNSRKTHHMKELVGAAFYLWFREALGLPPALEFARQFDL
jgi:hypothetical protein